MQTAAELHTEPLMLVSCHQTNRGTLILQVRLRLEHGADDLIPLPPPKKKLSH